MIHKPFPRILAATVTTNIRRMQQLVPPRVTFACLSTYLNRWCTARRFQKPERTCHFRCQSLAGSDSLEHYLCCPVLCDFATWFLGIKFPQEDRGCVGTLNCDLTDAELTTTGIWLYCIYTLYHFTRPALPLDFPVRSSLRRFAQQAVNGHVKAVKTFNARRLTIRDTAAH